MRRRVLALTLAIVALLVSAPAAFATDGGEGWYGEASDKNVTNAGFILIIAFPVIVTVFSLAYSRLEKRRLARWKAEKARKPDSSWQGGW